MQINKYTLRYLKIVFVILYIIFIIKKIISYIVYYTKILTILKSAWKCSLFFERRPIPKRKYELNRYAVHGVLTILSIDKFTVVFFHIQWYCMNILQVFTFSTNLIIYRQPVMLKIESTTRLLKLINDSLRKIIQKLQ